MLGHYGRSPRSTGTDVARRTPHVWSQGRKVAHSGMFGYRYSDYYRNAYIDPSRELARHMEEAARRYRLNAPATIADAATRVMPMRWVAGRSFRMVDKHGRAYGLRYTCQLKLDTGHYLAIDNRGREEWIHGSQKIRIVNKQPEDLMSQASRLLTRAHRQLQKDNE